MQNSSKIPGIKRININSIRNRNNENKLVCLTAHSAPMAKILDNNADIILVGDSLGMVVYGLDSTLAVTLRMMIDHGKAVVNATKKAFIIVDMPFGSYQASKEIAFKNAAKILSQTNCHAIKLEGGAEMAETIEFLVARGIPVVGHIGLQVQSLKQYGNFKKKGSILKEKKKILQDAKAVEMAGAMAVVIENVTEEVAKSIQKNTKITTIGIGASNICDGQIIVTEDILGMSDKIPPFAPKLGDLKTDIDKIIKKFAEFVRN